MRRPLVPLAAAAAALTFAAPASAGQLAEDRLTAPAGTAPAACLLEPSDGPGVARRTVTVPSPGVLSATTTGSGDWDLAVFDASGRRLAASASPDATERADGLAFTSGAVTVQACRRAGDATGLDLVVGHERLQPRAADAPPVQLVDVLAETREERARVASLGLDTTEHAGHDSVGVILHDDQDRQALMRAGFRWRIVEDDLVEADLADRRRDARYAARVSRAAIPSGRTQYRELADYEAELKQLAAANPSFVKLITLPEKTSQGRDVLGLEITENVNAADGKPAFFNMGVHHAREWPAGEMAMEWIYELVNGYKGGEARATNVVKRSRNIVVPIVNPDGFNISRSVSTGAGFPGGRDESVEDLLYIAASPNEYRRKNCNTPAPNCGLSAGLAEPGVDPNRNYGALWGGPGADQANPLAQTFPGAGPFSEVETRNVRSVVSRNQVMSLITNHTTAGLVLRAPGIASLGDSVDEPLYKALGDAMAKENGYFSQKSFELYDTTGTTEDWSYNVTGGLGFTFEVYCGDLNFSTGDCDDPAFHPTFETGVVDEWNGDSVQANHAEPDDTTANKGYDGQGNRAAYYLAAESAIEEARHSVLEGAAPAGATLRLTKAFQTETFPQEDGNPIRFDDKLETIYTVGADGRYRWHVNPSTRPIVAKPKGDPTAPADVTASPAETVSGGVAPGSTPDDPANDGAVAGATFPTTNSANYNDHPFTAPAHAGSVRNATLSIDAEWTTPTADWDMELYEDANGNGRSDAGEKVLSTSATGTGASESLSIVPEPGKKYVIRMTNFASVAEGYEITRTYTAPLPFEPAQREAYTMTCEVGGTVAETKQVFVDRGQVVGTDFPACAAAARAAAGAGGGGGATTPGTSTPAACVVADGLRSATAKARGRGVRFDFRRRVNAPVTVDVFRQSAGRRVTGEQLVARFAKRKRGFTWNGKANRRGRSVGDGYYFARYRIRTPRGTDVRRLVLRRSGGRFTVVRAGFHRRASCRLVRGFKLGRPVFGGTRGAPLSIALTPGRAATVRVTVLRGKKTVKRFRAVKARAGRTTRLRLASKGLRRGDYRVRVVVTAGSTRQRLTLTSRRL